MITTTVKMTVGDTDISWTIRAALEPMVDDAAVDAGYTDAAHWWRRVTEHATAGPAVEHLDNLIRELIALESHCRKLNPADPELGTYDGLLGALRAMRSFAHDYPGTRWEVTR